MFHWWIKSRPELESSWHTWGLQADKLLLGALAILSSPVLALKLNIGGAVDYFITVFHNDVITPTLSEQKCIKLQEILHQSLVPAVIDKPKWVRPCCPLRAGSSGQPPCPSQPSYYRDFLNPLPTPGSFLSSLSSFTLNSPGNLVPKIMCRYCSRLLKAVPAFSHPPQVLIYDQASLIFRSEVSYLIACIAPHHYLHWNVMG